MLKKSYIYLILTVVALLAAACSKAPELTEPSVPVPDMTNIITFDMLGTKVTNDDITDEEFIIYDYVDGVQYIDGSKYTLKYYDGAWRFFDSYDNVVDFYWTETGTHEFFAYNKVDYYSYNSQEDYWKVNFTFDDQNKCLTTDKVIKMLYFDGKYEDLIYAETTRDVESEDGYAPVEIHFNHMFASVKVTFRNNSLTKKTISDISLTNLYCSTDAGSVLYFNGSQDLSLGDANPYEFSVSQEVDNETEWDAFGTVIVLPQELGGMTEEVVWHEGGVEKRLHIYNDLGTDYWYAGKLYHYVITLDPTELSLEPTATIEHIEDDGGNKVSVVNVNLNAPVEELPRITSLLITVTDSDSNVIKTYEAATVDSNEISMECDELLDPGTYNVSVAYHDGLELRIVSTTADAAVQPAIGYYVNSDGTFSETFISSSSIAKIFWMGDPTGTDTDTKLEEMYPDCNRGLAYEVDENGDLKVKSGIQWTSFYYGTAGLTWGSYNSTGDTDRICGFNNTYYIKKVVTTNIMADFDLSSSSYTGVSPWYLPSFKEYKEVRSNDSSASTIISAKMGSYGFAISTLEAGTTCYGQYVNASDEIMRNNLSSYARSYFRILAF